MVCRVVDNDGTTVGQEYPGGVVGSPEDELLSDEGPVEDAVAATVLLLTPDELEPRLLEVLTAVVATSLEEAPVLLDEEMVCVWVMVLVIVSLEVLLDELPKGPVVEAEVEISLVVPPVDRGADVVLYV